MNWLANLRSVFDPVECAVSVIDDDLNVIYGNAGFVSAFGTYEGRKCHQVFNDRNTPCPACNIGQIQQGGAHRWEWRKEANQRTYQVLDSLLTDDQGRRYKLSLFHDITDQKINEEEILTARVTVKESRDLLEQTFSALQEGVLILTPHPDRRIVDCNAGAARIFGFTRDELLGQSARILHVDEARYQKFGEELFAGFREKGRYKCEQLMRRKSGEIFSAEQFARPIRDEAGEILKYVCVLRDITERKKTEEERIRMQEQISQASKLASLGTLAAGVAHEINNPLTVIQGTMTVVEQIVSSLGIRDERLNRFIAAQEKSISRISEIVRGLLKHARRETDIPQSFDTHEAIRDTISLVDYIYQKENIRIQTDLKAERSSVMGNLGKFHQVVMNLLVNAKEAIEEKSGTGVITITTENRDGSLILKVSDTGCGMDAETKAKIFGFLFTTKGQGKGTGLGLSITLSIVQSMKGTVEVESEPGVGSTFSVIVPTL